MTLLFLQIIRSKVFTQIAIDINDFMEETVDGSNTTQCTNTIVIQRKRNNMMVFGKFGDVACRHWRSRESIKERTMQSSLSRTRPCPK